MDADGDITVNFEGYGADVCNNINIPTLSSYVEGYLANGLYDSSLLTDLATAVAGGNTSTALTDVQNWFNNACTFIEGGNNLAAATADADIDITINLVLAQPQQAGTSAALLGRLGALINDIAGLLRGDANAIQFTQSDANIAYGTTAITDANITANSNATGRTRQSTSTSRTSLP